MNCLIYARVSTDKQADKELSIPAQLQAMRQHAEQPGWTILGEFVEAGMSGRTADRPSLRQLINRCRDHEQPQVGVVLVHKLDRLARNLADHVAIRAQLRDCAVTLASVTESVEDSVSGQLVEHILASMAEFYSANLSEEVKKGMRQKVLKGGWPHKPPYGYRIVWQDKTSRIVPDPVHAPRVRKAFEMCLTGYSGIIDARRRLAGIGLLSRNGTPLANSSLVRMLTNPFYCGQLRWNGESYPGSHEPLISVGLFDRVQRILKDRSRTVRRGLVKHLLTGIARCATCGSDVGGETHGIFEYYRCRSSVSPIYRCRAKYMPIPKVHAALETILKGVTLSASALEQLLQGVQTLELAKVLAVGRRRAALRTQLHAIESREAHLARTFAEGLMKKESLNQALEGLALERRKVGVQLAETPRDGMTGRFRRFKALLVTAPTAWDIFFMLTLGERRILITTVFKGLHIQVGGIERYELQTGIGLSTPIDNDSLFAA